MADPKITGVDWDLVNKDAANWARDHGGKLVKDISTTTRRRVGNSVANFYEEGLTIGDLGNRLGSIYSPQRAEMIAITEVTRAAAEGERAIAKELAKDGIIMVEIWETRNDGIVCSICEPRQGKQQGDGWTESDGPPGHPNCRCNIRHEFPKPKEGALVTNIVDISQATDIDIARSSIDNALDSGNQVTKKLHGMSSSESFTQIEYRDWSVYSSNNLDRGYIQDRIISLEQGYRGHEGIGNLYNQTSEIWLTSQQHSTIAGANATGGNGVVVLYKRDFIDVAKTLAHESGHNLSTNLFQSLSPGDDYLGAVVGEKAPTSYALTNSAEDFAESAYMYFFENERLLRTAPKRFNYFGGLFGK